LGLQGGQLLPRLVTFLVKIFARWQEGRNVGAWRPIGTSGRLLSPDQLIENVGTQLLELGRRQSQELVSCFVGLHRSPVIGEGIAQEAPQGVVMLGQRLLHPAVSTTLLIG
jgi:hypothetical protein